MQVSLSALSGSLFTTPAASAVKASDKTSALFQAAILAALQAESANAALAAGNSGGALSLEEYKQNIRGTIGSFQIHPSQLDTRYSVSIAEELFAKMQADANLERDILSRIAQELAMEYAVAPAFVSMRFDRNGAYSGSVGSAEYIEYFDRESADAFWTRDLSGLSASPDSKADEKTRREEKRQKLRDMEELLTQLAIQRRLDRQDMLENYQVVRAGGADYVQGTGPLVRPSVLESLI